MIHLLPHSPAVSSDSAHKKAYQYWWCDTGKAFKAAAKVIQDVVSSPELRYFDGIIITWRFDVLKAPWWGRLFERHVRSTKRLRITLGQASDNINWDGAQFQAAHLHISQWFGRTAYSFTFIGWKTTPELSRPLDYPSWRRQWWRRQPSWHSFQTITGWIPMEKGVFTGATWGAPSSQKQWTTTTIRRYRCRAFQWSTVSPFEKLERLRRYFKVLDGQRTATVQITKNGRTSTLDHPIHLYTLEVMSDNPIMTERQNSSEDGQNSESEKPSTTWPQKSAAEWPRDQIQEPLLRYLRSLKG